MLSVVILSIRCSVSISSVSTFHFSLKCLYTVYWYAEYRMLSVVILSVKMLCVNIAFVIHYAECYYTTCHYSVRHQAPCRLLSVSMLSFFILVPLCWLSLRWLSRRWTICHILYKPLINLFSFYWNPNAQMPPTSFPSNDATICQNGKQSTVNKSLDGSMYPGQKLAHSALGKKNHYC
jgi:hypothetical protein